MGCNRVGRVKERSDGPGAIVSEIAGAGAGSAALDPAYIVMWDVIA
ncbi:MAG: hypothetical protein WBN57_10505 [Gammaproteobacteria bacterium]